MLKVTNDADKLDEIQIVADAIFKSLFNLNPNPEDAMMALCLVLSFVIENNIEAHQWHKAVADVGQAVAANINIADDSEDEPDHGAMN